MLGRKKAHLEESSCTFGISKQKFGAKKRLENKNKKPKNRLPLLKCAYLLICKTGTQARMECPGLQISCITCSLSSHVSTQLSSEQSRVIQETKKIVMKKFFLLSQCKLYKAE